MRNSGNNERAGLFQVLNSRPTNFEGNILAKQRPTTTMLEALLDTLDSKDGAVREKARDRLSLLASPLSPPSPRHCGIPGSITFAGKQRKHWERSAILALFHRW
jgi:hypothetical protein